MLTTRAAGVRAKQHTSLRLLLLRGALTEMEWIPQVLQLPVVVERGRLSTGELERPEKLELFCGRTAAQRRILQKRLEPRLFIHRRGRFPFRKLDSLRGHGRQTAVQHDFDPECREIDVPRFEQRIQKRDAMVSRDVEY